MNELTNKRAFRNKRETTYNMNSWTIHLHGAIFISKAGKKKYRHTMSHNDLSLLTYVF